MGSCGAAGLMSAIATIESAHFIKSGELLELSDEQLLCCNIYSWGCKSGIASFAYDYGKKNKIMEASDWAPWQPDFDKCPMDRCSEASTKGKVQVSTYTYVGWHSVDEIAKALATGPVQTGIRGSEDVFVHYSSGILDSKDCGTKVNYDIAIVGFGHTWYGKPYYIIKN